MSLSVIILAAGKSTRIKSKLPKVMHPIASKPMIYNVIDAAKSLSPAQIITVISPDAEFIETSINSTYQDICFAVQEEQLGTANAVTSAIPELSDDCATVLVLYGDTPLITEKTLSSMLVRLNEQHEACMIVLGFTATDPTGYGRLSIKGNRLERIIECKDASADEKSIKLCNSGIIAIKSEMLIELIAAVSNNNNQKEFYLTDIVKIANDRGYLCSYFLTDEKQLLGVNSRHQLAIAEKVMQNRLRKKIMDNGVTLIEPNTVTLAYDTIIGQDCIIHPNVVFGKKVKVEEDVEIKSFSHIEGAIIKKKSIIGPFARVRPDSVISAGCRIGNFVEIKNSLIDENAKVNHLSYIGDAKIGMKTNIGAGTITCNYDGFNKHPTIIGMEVSIGANSSLIAPLNIADHAIIGAGSVISKDVPESALAITRAETVVKEGKASLIRKNKSGKK